MAKNVDFKNDIITLTFTSIPMQESFSAEHGSELFGNALEQFLDGGRVTNEGGSHLQATGRNVTNGSLDIVRDPFHKVRAVLVLDVKHLFIDFLHGHATSEDCCDGQVSAVAGITGSHHIFGIEHLLGELWYCQGSVLLTAPGGQGGKSRNEEVKTGEGNHVDGKFPKISVQLTREPEAGGDARHGERHQVIQVTISGCGKFQGTEANVVKGFVIDAEGFICVLNKLVDCNKG